MLTVLFLRSNENYCCWY